MRSRQRSSSTTVTTRRGSIATQAAAAAAAVAATTAAVSTWPALCVLSTAAAAGALAEAHTRWGRLLSAPLIALLLGAAGAALGLLPAASPVYGVVHSQLMPLAVALLLLDSSTGGVTRAGGPLLAAFALGCGTMLAGAALGWALCGPALAAAAGGSVAAAKVASCLVASYIGGSVNFAAVASATQLPSSLVPGAMAADNLGMASALVLLMAAPVRLAAMLRMRRQQQQLLGHRRVAAFASAAAAVAAGSGAAPSQDAPAASGPRGLDGQPLLTELPPAAETAACMEATAHGTSVAPRTMRSSGSSGSDSDSTDSSDSSVDDASAPSPAAACGGCRGSGVTALDDHPLLTRAPGSGDAIDTIAAARQGTPTVLPPPKPPAAGSWTTQRQAPGGRGASSNGSGSSGDAAASGEGCGACSDALDAIAAASPAPSFPRSPSRLSSRTGPAGSNAHEEQAPPGAPPQRAGAGSARGGPLALDGSPLLTEEPDVERLAVAMATAKRGSGSSSVTVTPLSSDEFGELLVAVDRDSLVQRLADTQAAAAAAAAKGGGATAAAPPPRAPGGQQQQQQKPRVVVVEAPAGGTPPRRSRYARERRRHGGPGLDGGASALTPSSGALALAAAACACGVSHAAATALGQPALHQLFLAGAALALSAAGGALARLLSPQRRQAQQGATTAPATTPFAGAGQLGQLLIGLFFAALGAACCPPGAASGGGVAALLAPLVPLLAFIAVMVATHWAGLALLGGRLLRLPAPVLLCGSAAAVGGAATAAGLASARGWDVLVRPALVVGGLGYAVGTLAGLAAAAGLGVLPLA